VRVRFGQAEGATFVNLNATPGENLQKVVISAHFCRFSQHRGRACTKVADDGRVKHSRFDRVFNLPPGVQPSGGVLPRRPRAPPPTACSILRPRGQP
jgi:hypothetical protein